MESTKLVLMNLFAEQQWRPKHREQTCEHGRGGEGGPNRKSSIETCMHAKSPQPCRLCATQWTVAHQAPLSMKFSKRKYWSGLPFPSPGNLPHSGIEPASPVLADGFFTTSAYSNC